MFDLNTMMAMSPPSEETGSKRLTEYDPATGKIISNFILQNEIVDMLTQQGKVFVDDWYDAKVKYIVDGKVEDRPVQLTKLDGMNLTNLPVPCTITIDGKDYSCDEDHCELEFTLPKTYNIGVTAFPNQDVSFSVTVS